jgi:YidC/Oxa1 family membrane protein insertase
MWDAIRDGLGTVLAFFYGVIPSSGVAIILLTVAVRLAMFPLTAKQAKSMLAMQRAQPEIKKLQAKYKNDRQKLNEETMKFYKENEINPLGGCLPLLVQMPVFIALYQTLRHIEKFIPENSKMFQDICNGETLARCSAAKNLPDMKFLGMNLTESAAQASKSGIGEALPYLVLVGLVVVTGFVQQRQTMRNQVNPNPQMAIIGKIFPLMFAFISWGLPAGVGLYFATSNLWQVGQQEVVFRTIGTAAGGPPPKKSRGSLKGGDDATSGDVLVDDPPTTDSAKSGKSSSGKQGGSKGSKGSKGSTGSSGKSQPQGSKAQASKPQGSQGKARSNRKRKR